MFVFLFTILSLQNPEPIREERLHKLREERDSFHKSKLELIKQMKEIKKKIEEAKLNGKEYKDLLEELDQLRQNLHKLDEEFRSKHDFGFRPPHEEAGHRMTLDKERLDQHHPLPNRRIPHEMDIDAQVERMKSHGVPQERIEEIKQRMLRRKEMESKRI